MKKVEKVTYVAFDGTEFEHSEGCILYERGYVQNNVQKIADICMGVIAECQLFENFGYGSEEYYYGVFVPATMKDIELLNIFQSIKHSSSLNNERVVLNERHIGKRVYIALGYGNDFDFSNGSFDSFYIYGSIDDMMVKLEYDIRNATETKIEDKYFQ